MRRPMPTPAPKSDDLKFSRYAAQPATGRSPGKTDPDSIPERRRKLFYGGMAVVAVGLLLFCSPFVAAVSEMDRGPTAAPFDFRAFDQSMHEEAVRMKKSFSLGFLGFVLFVGGGIMMSIGRHGAAGSGFVLDPRRAREELKPFARQAGGMVKDAMDAAGVRPGAFADRRPETTVVKIRCRACGALSDESSRFCGQCGKPL